jgi:predicted outer membrane repeat protein
MNNGTISGNTGVTDGGGVYVASGTFTMNGGSITGHSVTGNGGGVYVASGTFTLSNGNIGASGSGNTAAKGGGLYIAGGTTNTMSGGSIGYNTASTSGGGVYIRNEFVMTSGIIENNEAKGNNSSTDGGGGVYVAANCIFTMKGDSQIILNKATSDYGKGGGVYNNGIFKMLENSAIGDKNALSDATSKTVCSNYAENDGGGIYNANVTNVKFEMASTSHIKYNYSNSFGGGLFNNADASSITITKAQIIHNGANKTSTSQYGGQLPE